MDKKYMKRIFNLFKSRIIATSYKCGAGQQYIQGQLDEGLHQIELELKKLHGSNRHGV